MPNPSNYILQYFNQEANRSNFDISEREGSLFLITSQSGKTYQIDERVLDLTIPQRDKKVKIPKSDWNYELPKDLFIALVILLVGIDPTLFLIPSKVFLEPDNYIFFDNEQAERFKHLSNWEIKVFGKGMEKLSEYAFDKAINNLA